MANANTIYLAKTAAPLVNPTGTAQVFTQPLPLVGSQTPVPAFVLLPDFESYPASNTISTEPAPVPAVNAPQGTVVWAVKVKGRVTTGATSNFTVGLYLGNSTTLASNTLLATFAAGVYTGAISSHFYYEAILAYDPTSLTISGVVAEGFGGSAPTLAAPAAIAPVALNLQGVKAQVVATGLFSVSNPANTVVLDEFSLEQY